MARDWSEEPTFQALQERLELIAPDNTAPMPIACALQRDVNGIWGWTVDVHVRIPHVTEYEVSGAGKTLAGALRRAYLGLNNIPQLTRSAALSNATFGITV